MLLPDVLVAHSGWAGTPVIGTIDEDPDAPGGDWLDPATTGSSPTARVGFPTPAGTPSGVQTFKARIGRQGDGVGNPTTRIDLYENGVLKASGAEQAISTTKANAGQVISQTFDLASTPLTTADGSGVEARVVVTAYTALLNDRSASLDAVNWDTVNYTGPPPSVSGAAAITGGGTLASTGAKGASTASTVTGGGALASTGVKGSTDSVALSGGGAASAQGAKATGTSSTVSGGGTLTTTGTAATSGTTAASITGGGTISSTGTAARQGTSTLSGGGAPATAGTSARATATVLTGGGVLAAAGFKQALGTSTLTGGGTLAATGTTGAASTYALLTPTVARDVELALSARPNTDLALRPRPDIDLALEPT